MKLPTDVVVAAVVLALCGCHGETRWAIRIPEESRTCTQKCDGAPDEPKWRECIAACGGDVKEGWCDGTTSSPVDPKGCRQAETKHFSIGGTIVLVVLLVAGGAVALGVINNANRRP